MIKSLSIFAACVLVVFLILVFGRSKTEAPTKGASPTGDAAQTTSRTIHLYMVALEDNGKSGVPIGCGDSIVPVSIDIYISGDPVVPALNALLAAKDRYYEKTSYYNSLYSSSLQVKRVEQTEKVVSIYMTGDLLLGGVCDSPRVEEQLTHTVKQFESKKEVRLYLNDKPLKEALSGK